MTEIIIKTFKSQLISSNMYAITYKNDLIIIDPCISKEAYKYIKDNSLSVDYIILTHEHYDHISGVNWLRELFDCKVICSKQCAEAIQYPNLNFSKYFNVLMEILPKDKELIRPLSVEQYSCFADMTFEKHKIIEWNGHKMELICTPGHSKGSICILFDNKYLFSGDSLLRDYPTVTRLKGGDSKKYNSETLKFLKLLSPKTVVYPGHFEAFDMGNRVVEKQI